MVLFSGGFNGTNAVATAELYDPATGKFVPTGSLNVARDSATSTLLANGQVLVAAGAYFTGPNSYSLVVHYLGSAELYDPASGTFTLTGSLNFARAGHTATLLGDGDVLIAGGGDSNMIASGELYNPTTGSFAVTGSLNTPRDNHTAQLLGSGEVLIIAGYNNGSLTSSELYDPARGKFSKAANLNTPRYGHASALLPNGEVLAEGGFDNLLSGYAAPYLASAELFH